MKQMQSHYYRTRGGVGVYRASMGVNGPQAVAELAEELNEVQGVLLSSSYEYPGRYARWDIGFSAPPLRLTGRGRHLQAEALNERGSVLLKALHGLFEGNADLASLVAADNRLDLHLLPPEPVRFEEDRSRRRTVFSLLRSIIAHMASPEDEFLGLYGAFGYDLCFQFEDVQRRLTRSSQDREMVVYLPDSILVVDHKRELAQQHSYDFEFTAEGQQFSTEGRARDAQRSKYTAATGAAELQCDHEPGEYAATVGRALRAFQRGDMFEVVPTRTFSRPCPSAPAAVFRRLQTQNPAPYGALMNLGGSEYLVAASPEMYVRVRNRPQGREVETCPISGTIARGKDALQDAEQIRRLLNSAKDEAELSMCTDVDRNDKSRVCIPGSVQVTGRRLVEIYSRLIHTVDHVKGLLQPDKDGLDAFLSHTWAVTVTGAPKHAAMQFIEDHERSARHWYGGAIGCLNFNGSLNTGLTIRTIRICQGLAEIRAGATLLSDSVPQAEEDETLLKASALIRALQEDSEQPSVVEKPQPDRRPGRGMRILMVDHQDSFVHTLAAYFRQTGAEVRTVRPQLVAGVLQDYAADLLVLSPGPGRPVDFSMSDTVRVALQRNLAIFGVCLGLQGIVEFFGGSLRTLATPMHGKTSMLQQMQGPLFRGLPVNLAVGRYHSLVADRVPECLRVTARSDDGEVMAIQHAQLPVHAVQFHPESILSAQHDAGRHLLENLLQQVREAQ